MGFRKSPREGSINNQKARGDKLLPYEELSKIMVSRAGEGCVGLKEKTFT